MYGSFTLTTSRSRARTSATSWFSVEVRQSDDEAELVGWLHEAADAEVPVIFNPAAFTHYSYALRDACAQLTAPSRGAHHQPATREEFRHTSVIAGVATGTVAGFGADSYLSCPACHSHACDVRPTGGRAMTVGEETDQREWRLRERWSKTSDLLRGLDPRPCY